MTRCLPAWAVAALVFFTPCVEASPQFQEPQPPLVPAVHDARERSQNIGGVSGLLLDASGAVVAGAQVSLVTSAGQPVRTLASGPHGDFTFADVPSGCYRLNVIAAGFASFMSGDVVVTAQEVSIVPDISLSISAVTADVTVRPTAVIAAEQLKAARQQRLFGGFPNFYVSYVPDAAPLTPRQKFSLAAWDTFDWASLQGVTVRAGLEQATNAHAGYGQGMAGYGKRWAAVMAGQASRDLLSHAVFASLLHQDPRYFYKGTGTRKDRLLHALKSVVIARSDRGTAMPNYSYLLGDLGSAALANAYYPRADRSVSGVFVNAAIGLAGRAAQAVMREFAAKRPTP